jgi:hypothetical protein
VLIVRALAFGDRDAGSWGVVWTPGDDSAISLAGASGSATGILTGELNRAEAGGAWRVEGDGTSLLFTPSGPTAHGAAPGGSVSNVDQLCTVSGALRLGGTEREISSMGWRTTLEGSFELDRMDSFRQASAWFEPTQGFSLVAFRPRKSRGQEADLVAAALLEPEPTPPVADPRLSTTYDAAGRPARAGLELWLEEEEGGDRDESDRHFPRRAAGESVGAGVDWEIAGFDLSATPLRWHTRGMEGSGVYLLGRRR